MGDEPTPTGPAASPPPTPTPAHTPRNDSAPSGGAPAIKVEVPPIPPFEPAFPMSPVGMRAGKFEFNLKHMVGGFGLSPRKVAPAPPAPGAK